MDKTAAFFRGRPAECGKTRRIYYNFKSAFMRFFRCRAHVAAEKGPPAELQDAVRIVDHIRWLKYSAKPEKLADACGAGFSARGSRPCINNVRHYNCRKYLYNKQHNAGVATQRNITVVEAASGKLHYCILIHHDSHVHRK